MKRIIYVILLTCSIGYAQHTGIIMENYGKVYKIANPDLDFDKDKQYNAVFDIYTDSPDNDKTNPLLKNVARYLQIHTQYGVPKENMKVAVILHGAATKNALSDKAYEKQFDSKNPNSKLIKALKDANVQLYICGQSYSGKGYDDKDKKEEIKMALSAMTALIWYQKADYQVINFN